MGLKKLVIFLDQPIFYSGQNLSGRLVVHVDKPMQIRAIYLKYSGKANVEWSESRSSDNSTDSDTYSNAEQYLRLQQLVFGKYVEDCELPEGEHVFLFNCQLPMNLPSSFEGVYGSVRYFVEAIIHRSWKSNYNTVHSFSVMSVCDLNLNPLAATPVTEQGDKSFWGQSGTLFMTVKLPIRGFVSGQTIPITVFLNNQPGVQIKSLDVILKQHVTFRATAKSRSSENEVFKYAVPLPEGPTCMEVPINLRLPSVPSSYLEFCKIIDLKYELSITARVKSLFHRNLTVRTELIVGNIPLMSYEKPISIHQLHPESADQNNPSYSQAPSANGSVAPPGMIYEDLPPPSYEQCIRLNNSKRHNPHKVYDSLGEDKEFAPLYPVYKFEQSRDQA